jgi:hypothetical protein
MQKVIVMLCMGLGLLSLNVCAEGKKIVKWVDSQGVTHYGDKLPTQETGRSNVEMDNRGIVLKKNVVLNQQSAAIDQQKEQEKLDQARRDKILLASYTNAEEIDLARDRNIETDQATLQALMQQKLVTANRTTRNNKTAQGFLDRNKPLPAHLTEELKLSQIESDNIDKQIKQRRLNMQATSKRYAEEKTRFIALKQSNSSSNEAETSTNSNIAK